MCSPKHEPMKTKWTNPEIQRCLPRHVRSAPVRSTMQNFRTLGKGDQRNFGPLPSRKGNDDSFSVDQAKVLRIRESRYPMRTRYQQILLVSVHDHLIVIPPKTSQIVCINNWIRQKKIEKGSCALWLSLGLLGSNLGSSVLNSSVLALRSSFCKENRILDCFHAKGRWTVLASEFTVIHLISHMWNGCSRPQHWPEVNDPDSKMNSDPGSDL